MVLLSPAQTNAMNESALASGNDLNSRQPVVSKHVPCSVRANHTAVALAALPASVVALSVLCPAQAYAQGPNVVLEWNLVASDAAVAGGQNSVVQTRTFAMVQAAVHDALNAIDRRYEPYVLRPGIAADRLPRRRPQSRRPHTTSWWDSSRRKAGSLAAAYVTALSTIADGPTQEAGMAAGAGAAAAILALRADDGAANANRPYTPGTEPGDYQPTTPNAPVVTPGWGEVDPFVLEDLAGLHPPPPYSLEALRYAQDFSEVKSIGAARWYGAR